MNNEARGATESKPEERCQKRLQESTNQINNLLSSDNNTPLAFVRFYPTESGRRRLVLIGSATDDKKKDTSLTFLSDEGGPFIVHVKHGKTTNVFGSQVHEGSLRTTLQMVSEGYRANMPEIEEAGLSISPLEKLDLDI